MVFVINFSTKYDLRLGSRSMSSIYSVIETGSFSRVRATYGNCIILEFNLFSRFKVPVYLPLLFRSRKLYFLRPNLCY